MDCTCDPSASQDIAPALNRSYAENPSAHRGRQTIENGAVRTLSDASLHPLLSPTHMCRSRVLGMELMLRLGCLAK